MLCGERSSNPTTCRDIYSGGRRPNAGKKAPSVLNLSKFGEDETSKLSADEVAVAAQEDSGDYGDLHLLVFHARVGDIPLEGVDLLRLDSEGLVREFTVMIRPLEAI